jgi:UDP-glucose:(heptosyl)LPS alpha-1,3-glucosyltransferase
MKIALVRREFRLRRGGAERYGLMLANGLLEAGHEVHLFAARVDPTLPPGLVHHPVPSIEFWSPLRRWMFYRTTTRRIAPGDFDIVQALEPYAPHDVYQAGDGFHRFWLDLPEGRSSVLSFLTPQHPVKLELERRAFRPGSYGRIIAPSQLVKRQTTRLYRVPADRIDVIEPPVDIARFASIREQGRSARRAEWGLGEDDLLLAFVGLNYRRKGLATLLDAIARLAPRFHGVVVGRDRRARSFARRARGLGIADRVHFAGEAEGVEDIVAAADVFVLPSLYDPFGLVVAEAMAAGRPVVVSRRTGAADLVTHGESGYVLEDERDPDELARYLNALADPAQREEFGRHAAEAVQHLTLERHIGRVLEVYDRVIESREPPARATSPARIASEGTLEFEQSFAPDLRLADVRDYATLAALPVVRTLHAVRPERRTDLVALGETQVVRKLYIGDPDGGRNEWSALVTLAREGLLGPPPLALGADARGSAVLMEFVEGEAQLDHWAAEQLGRLRGRERARTKRRILDALADHVRAFHEKGFTHRDLYLCHVWIREKPELQLRFMDLHRVEQHARIPRRLRVKDLAALHFSASRWVQPSRSDQLRFFERYLGVPTLGPEHLRLARSVLRKSARIEHHNRGREV